VEEVWKVVEEVAVRVGKEALELATHAGENGQSRRYPACSEANLERISRKPLHHLR